MSPRVRVLVVDDSQTVREIIVAALREDPCIEVVGEAGDGVEALALANALRPDVLTLDLQMPHLGGFEVIPLIMAQAPTRVLVVCAVNNQTEVDLSMRAVAAGALEVIAKPVVGTGLSVWSARLREAVRLMAEIPVVRRRRDPSLRDAGLSFRRSRVDAIGIAASTGGPPALGYILCRLPRTLSVPLFIAQHMSPGFTAGLVRWLSEETSLCVRVASTQMEILPGHVYFPADGCDLEIAPGRRLLVSASRSIHVPCADLLFTSMAKVYGARCGGIVLTGMGEDGARGLLSIRRAGGATLAQDEPSSVVYGMPSAAKELDPSVQVLPLTAMATAIRELSEV